MANEHNGPARDDDAIRKVRITPEEWFGPQGDWRRRTTDDYQLLQHMLTWPNPLIDPPLISDLPDAATPQQPPSRRCWYLTEHLLLAASLIALGTIIAAIILGAIR
jgi:hypothetical protein